MIKVTTKLDPSGNTVVLRSVYMDEDKRWWLNDIDYQHPIQLFRKEIIEYLGKNVTVLSNNEISDLQNNTFKANILEILDIAGYSIEEIEIWLYQCYTLGANPLPTLRKLVNCKVEFNYDNGGTIPCYTGDEDTIFVVVTKPSDRIENVCIFIVPK